LTHLAHWSPLTVHRSLCAYQNTHTHTHSLIHKRMHTHLLTAHLRKGEPLEGIHVYKYMYVYIHIYIYTYIYIHVNTYTYIHICIYIVCTYKLLGIHVVYVHIPIYFYVHISVCDGSLDVFYLVMWKSQSCGAFLGWPRQSKWNLQSDYGNNILPFTHV